MELKSYQKQVLADLASYLQCLQETNTPAEAYRKHWMNHDIPVGAGGLPAYQNTITDVPHICTKVPTGGGKTFIGASAVKPIFEALPSTQTHAVVWLVPSNAILEQTIRTLSNPDHPYRQRLDRDFGGRVVVYTKEQLLSGQNFNPTAVQEQLSVCVLSYDSLRSAKKDGRKVYQQNSQLASFAKHYPTPDTLVEDVDDTALIQVLNQLSPIVIVDESHNAKSDLSVEMLINLNPTLVLDLTATPKKNSNIISYVDARELKKENMVKLPVVVYNRNNKLDVIHDTIRLRHSIEQQAIQEKEAGGSYIRPIVLFQAQPKGKEDSSTFEKLKAMLIECGVPTEEIAIKTSNINEIKGIDLLSPQCKIRYIITVNALKEGWDCPFAYILATLANKTSQVDVEQIVGRVLRQPYAKKHNQPLLNNSYVLTCSNAFRDTLENIVKGLNRAGFSRDDMRVASEEEAVAPVVPVTEPLDQVTLADTPMETEEFLDFDVAQLRDKMAADQQAGATGVSDVIVDMIEQAEQQAAHYEEESKESEKSGLFGGELGQMMNQFKMQDEFAEEAATLEIPQFFFETEVDLFHTDGFTLAAKEGFSTGFILRNEDIKIKFDLATGDAYTIDIRETGAAVPKYKRMTKTEQDYLRDHLASMPTEQKIRTCTDMICSTLNKSDTLETNDVKAYVQRIVEGMTADETAALESSIPSYTAKIKEKIESLETAYREKEFDKRIDMEEVVCRPSYRLPAVITPTNENAQLDKSLYESEGSMNDFEHRVISIVASMDNIKWWHRIIERKGFYINGFIHHYPDFMVMTKSGKLIMIETKGEHLANDDSKQKLHLGRVWADKAGAKFKYFMVFKTKDFGLDGAYALDEFAEIVGKL